MKCSNSAEKEQGHSQPKDEGKLEARTREDIREKETTTRTTVDLQKKKLDSAGWRILM